jgi:hypothetical protein
MKGIVITPKSQTELKFVTDLLKKLGISTSTMTDEEMEDLGLLKLMKAANKSKTVSRDSVMKKLNS